MRDPQRDWRAPVQAALDERNIRGPVDSVEFAWTVGLQFWPRLGARRTTIRANELHYDPRRCSQEELREFMARAVARKVLRRAGLPASAERVRQASAALLAGTTRRSVRKRAT